MRKFKICSLFLLSFLFVLQTFAQDVKTEVVEINFGKRDLISDAQYRVLRKLNRGDFVKFKIIDTTGELNKYKVIINKKDSVVPVNDAPVLFSSFLSPDGFVKFLTGIMNFSIKTPGASSGIKEALKDEFEEYIILNSNKISLMNKAEMEKDFTTKFLNGYKSLVDTVVLYKDSFVNDSYKFIDSIVVPVSRFVLKVNTRKLKNDTIFYDSATFYLSNRDRFVRQFEERFNRYLNITIRQTKRFMELNDVKKGDSVIINLRKGFYEYLKGFDSTFNVIKVSEVYNSLVKMRPPKSFEYRSMPFQVKGDMSNFTINFEPVKTDEGLQSYSTEFTLPNRINRVLTFSTGIFYAGLADERYSNKLIQIQRPGNTDSLRYQLIQEDVSKGSFGINALLHIGTRIYNDIGVHLAFGPGLTLEKNPSPTLHLGGGLFFGRQNKLFLTAGINWGFVEVLSKGYNTTVTYEKEQSGFTYDQLKSSGFISITYSFLK